VFFPAWFRRRKLGWLPFGVARSKMAAQVDGQVSCLMRHVLRHFFSPDHFNLSIGMRLPGSFFIRIRSGPMIQDMDSHRACLGVTGSAGIKCCIKCMSTVRMDLESVRDHPYLQHFSIASPEGVQLHTPTSYATMADILSVVHGQVTNEKFKVLQKVFGLNYRPQGLLWDRHLRQYFNPAQHTYEDSMHVLFASGGVAQYEVNGFVLALGGLLQFIGHSVPGMLDDFHDHIKWPVVRRLRKNFFAQRVRGVGENLKAFAVETMAAVEVLWHFCSMVLQPAEQLPLHCRSMGLLCAILDHLSCGEEVVHRTDALRRCIGEHRPLFLELYGIAKPKLHHLGHIPDSIDQHGVYLDCRPMETMHISTKEASAHSMQGASSEKLVLTKMLLRVFAQLEETEFHSAFLRDPIACDEIGEHLRPLLPGAQFQSHIGKHMESHIGELHIGTLIEAVDVSGVSCTGRVQVLASARESGTVNGWMRCFIIMEMYRPTSGGMLVPSGSIGLAAEAEVIRALPHSVVGDAVLPLRRN
jgi:hypothetical protein